MTGKPGPTVSVVEYCESCHREHRRILVTPEQLLEVHGTEDDIVETERLKQHVRDMLVYRKPYAFLNLSDFRRILRWKLRGQLGRPQRLRQLSDQLVVDITSAAFREHNEHNPSDEVTKRCVELLDSLPGVGVPTASAVLALTFPNHYCVVDFRGWRALFGEDQKNFSSSQYLTYLSAVRCIASKLGWSPQEADHALWGVDVEQDGMRRDLRTATEGAKV